MKKRLLIVALLAVLVPSLADCPREPCTHWTDVETGLVFPSRLGGLVMTSRTVYREDNWSLRYDSDDSRAVRAGGSHLDFYVYPQPHEPKVKSAAEEVESVVGEIRQMERHGRYHDVKIAEKTHSGKLKRSELPYAWRGLSLKFEKDGERHLSAVLVAAFRGRFLKLRYSTVVSDRIVFSETEFPPQFILALSEFDGMVKRTLDARAVDVYAIKSPEHALEALRAKWPGADQRISEWKKPDHADECARLQRAMRWCDEKMDERCETFERVARAGLRLRIEPDNWYYNLACALARQKKPEPAFTALEQAVAAGFNDGKHMRKDLDLESLRTDPRLERLAVLAESWPVDVNRPDERALRKGNVLPLSKKNVRYSTDDNMYHVEVSGLSSMSSGAYPVLFADRGGIDHDAIMKENPSLVEMTFPSEAVQHKRNIGTPNLIALDVEKECCHPLFAVCGLARESSPSNSATGLGMAVASGVDGLADPAVRGMHVWNVLPFYAADADWGADGIDRHLGWFPGCLEYVGGDAAPFVRAANAALQELRPSVRDGAVTNGVLAQVLIGLVRGDVWRPALSPSDLDFAAITNRARALAAVPPSAPLLVRAEFSSDMTAVTDLWDTPYNHPHLAGGLSAQLFVHTWGERTGVYTVESRSVDENAAFEWSLLQGDPAKVRIAPLTNTSARVRIEVDWHDVFDVALPGGRSIKSARVDVGCRVVEKGVRSIPSVVSVYFSPNAMRTYDEKGRVASIDYTKPQLPAYRPKECVRGDWRDEFHWTDDGRLLGWTRIGEERREEFTREGLVVMSRDRQGRPDCVWRNLRGTFFQETAPWMSPEQRTRELQWLLLRYDETEVDGPAATLQWRYSYKDDADRFGKPEPMPPKDWSYRSELCRRIDFAGTNTGFRLPAYRQMQLSGRQYTKLKYAIDDSIDIDDLLRSDGANALAERGLKPPKVLQRMKLCPWKSSSADAWKIDVEEIEQRCVEHLKILGDGACRFLMPGEKGSEGEWWPVQRSLRAVNAFAESMMYEKLDAAYARCSEETASVVFRGQLGGDVWEKLAYVPKGWMNEQPAERQHSFAAWQIAPKTYLGILCDWESGYQTRTYMFAQTPTAEASSAIAVESFDAPPARAVGNTVLAAARNEADAQNNLAVLLYGEVASPGDYEEPKVARMLMKSARQGNVTAMRNLAILYTNRGEPARAEKFLEAARLKEEADRGL